MTTELGRLRVLSVSHRTAALDELERLAFAPAARSALLRRLRERGIPAVVLCTCHRTELYWRSRDREDDAAAEAALRPHVSRRNAPSVSSTCRCGWRWATDPNVCTHTITPGTASRSPTAAWA